MNAVAYAIHEAARADLARLDEHTTRSHRAEPVGDDANNGWLHEQTWRFADGECVTLEGTSNSDLFFPATASYEVLSFEAPTDGDPETFDIGEHVRREPVIGWNLLTDQGQDQVIPITVEGREGQSWDFTFKAVAFPDGRVSWYAPFHQRLWADGYGTTCASFEKWISLVREVWPEQARARAEEEKRRTEASKPCQHCGRHGGELGDEIPF